LGVAPWLHQAQDIVYQSMEEYPEKQASEIARKAAEDINSAIEWHRILSKSRILISAKEERVIAILSG